jgi:hypothetical protein
MPVHVVQHPLIRHKIALARESKVTTKDFRELASEIATLLTYEATKDLETEKETIQGWAGPVEVEKIKGKKITVVPILRAGLGMMPGVLNLIPAAKVSIVGLYRNELLSWTPCSRPVALLWRRSTCSRNPAARRSKEYSWWPPPKASGASKPRTPTLIFTLPPWTRN